MKRGFEAPALGKVKILLLTILFFVGLLPGSRPVWGADKARAPSQPLPALPATASQAADRTFDVDQIHAQLTFFSVPTELAETAISAWTLAPFDQGDLVGADPFAAMNQPLQSSLKRQRGKSGDTSRGHVAAGTERRLPSAHKILDDQQARQLVSQLKADDRTRAVFSPQLAFIDGMTATAVVGEKRSFVVGWSDDLPQTRIVPQGKMVRLRTVLDEERMWLDYEIVLSRILDVSTRSIRVANRPQPVHLAVPNVETTKAAASVELPVGGTLLIGGLPAERQDGIPHQLVVLVRADRMKPLRMKRTAKPGPGETAHTTAAAVADPAPVPAETVSPRPQPAQKKRNPFSLISRILNRSPRQAAEPMELTEPRESNILIDTPRQE